MFRFLLYSVTRTFSTRIYHISHRNVNQQKIGIAYSTPLGDEKYIEETIPAMEFIKRLIRHIPEKHFKMIRYGGLYARHKDIDSRLHRVISQSKHGIYRSFHQ